MNKREKRKLLFHSGRIYTQDRSFPFCQAMIVAGSEIAWLGNNSDLYAIPSDEYQIIDLEGKTVLPAFCDAHAHLTFWALSLKQVDLDGCQSHEEALKRIRKHAENLKRGEWLLGQGWQRAYWKKRVWPHKSDLDKIIPGNPVAIFSKDEHLLWVNSRALQIAGIDHSTPDPAGGSIDRDESGEPTGILKEKATDLVFRLARKPTGERAYKIFADAQRMAHALGITSVGTFDGIDGFALLQDFHRKKGLKLRVSQYIPSKCLDDLLRLSIRSGLGDPFLRIQGVKIFADGALGSQTAYMFKPFEGSTSNYGIAQTEERELEEMARRSVKGGLNVAIHAIGDRANQIALKAIINASGKSGRNFRHRIEHCQLLRKEDIPKFGRHGIICSVQPSHIVSDIDLVNQFWGKRGRYAYAFRSLMNSGGILAFGSDAPIEKPNPLWEIYCAVTRTRPADGITLYPMERISVEQAVRAHTWGGAFSLGMEDKLGSISIGKYADMVILDQDLYKMPPEEIPAAQVMATLWEGEFVYGQEMFISERKS